jgi:hypothetical protein
VSRVDQDELDRQHAEERLRERDVHREPRLPRCALRNLRRWAFQASVIDSVNTAESSASKKEQG